MGLSSVVQWWQEWQLRILVLGSLFVHIFLFIAPSVRRFPALHRLRVLMWIAYISGDALAVYALATLFNRHKQQAADGRNSSALEVVWAPFLLIHLGGQMSISAYSLEDNELWKRHVITLVSQVTVALYVFCKWWSGEKTLMLATVLLFVVGIIKFSQKPWALKKASFKGMLASSAGAVPTPRGCCNRFTAFDGDIARAMSNGGGGEEDDDEECAVTLEQYVTECVRMTKVASDEKRVLAVPTDYVYKMFVDLSLPYSRRLRELRVSLNFTDEIAYDLLQRCLESTFQRLYTKLRVAATPLGSCLSLSLPFLVVASVVLFAKSHKDGYDHNDVVVTYILFCCTLAQELLLPFLLGLCLWCLGGYTFRWHGMVSQYSLMSYCARKGKPTILMKLATFNYLREYVNKNWYVSQVLKARQITKLVHKHVKDGWDKDIRDAASYRGFNNLRGHRTLWRQYPELKGCLGWILTVPFDESVLLWHIATDLCFHSPDDTSARGGHQQELEAAQRGREISNYMIYLLFIRPEMLMPGARPALFTRASNQILKDRTEPFDKEERIARQIIERSAVSHGVPPPANQNSLLSKACSIAEVLMGLGYKERWEVIEGVWVEMLCYSAARCTGYLHARSLGECGEYLSYVWLLLSFMGMETLADKLHKPEPPQYQEEEETAAAGASASRPQAGGVGQTAEISSSPT